MSTPRKSLGAAFAIALAAGTVSVVAPTANAAVDGSNVVINEVYGGGGNAGGKFNNDFVELYNPTDAEIDISGWKLNQKAANGNTGNTVKLSGKVPAKGFFLIQGDSQDNEKSQDLPKADLVGSFNFGAKAAIAELIDNNGQIADLVGWGTTAKGAETSPAKGTANATSVQRKDVGVDTDNNAIDFIVAEPTPQNSGNTGETPVDPTPEDPTDPTAQPEQPQPGEITPIAEIQGTGHTSPFKGKNVTTRGVVTAVYASDGSKRGFYIQTPGTGGSPKQKGDASDGIFVYMGRVAESAYPEIGDFLEIAGTADEYTATWQVKKDTVSDRMSTTQLRDAKWQVIEKDADFKDPAPISLESLPAGDDARESYEGMLVNITGPYTVTNNYTLNNTGDIGLAPGDTAHRTPTDIVSPGSEANALQDKQDAEVVHVDDGRNANYFRTDKQTPLPYLVTSDNGIKSIRTGDQVQFQTPVVVDFSYEYWRFQPLQPITGKNVAAELPITWEDSRADAYDDIDNVEGDYSIGFFNVLNYFSTLGKDVSGCKAYNDIYGKPVGAKNCNIRGAFSQNAFKDQQAKIVTAINKLDTDVLGLSEIENTASVTGDVAKRDEALQNLVDALNAKEPGKWDLVKSPQKLGTDEDFIRVAFIYQPAKVKPVGESVIFDDPAFTKTARQPLAQVFDTVGNDEDKNFVAVVNHYKSKGSVAKGDEDTGDGQGNNARIRAEQSKALLKHLGEQKDWADLPTFLVGDFNAYTKEDAITALVDGGFNIVESEKDYDQASYQFDGQLGTLDHVLANAAAMELVKDSAVWNINGDESAAFEYSRRNYNAQDFFGDGDDPIYGYGNPFRSSDHDPVKVGFGTKLDEKDADKFAPEASEEVTVTQGDQLPDAKATVKDADQLPADTKFEWTKPANTDTVGDGQEGEITVTYPDKTVDTVKVTVNVKPKAEEEEPQPEEKPRYIVKAEINDSGELVVTYENGDTENLGEVKGADGKPGKDGEQGPKGDKGDKGDTGAPGKDGKDGRDGIDGKDGQPGKDGADGKPGKDGEQGPKGDKGDTGAAGQDGKDGKDGRGVKSFEINDEGHLIVTYSDGETVDLGKVTGDKGSDGKDGVDGKPGKDGERGPKGDTGAPGKDGADGTDGRDGIDGKPGKDGERGPKGDTGAPGKDGADGTDGRDGIDGKDGQPGKNGADGEQGPKGDKGDTGAAGQDGKDGAKGKKGADGKDGRDGIDGKDGQPGKNGADGEQGPKGDKGDTGAAGQDGKDGEPGTDGRGIAEATVNENGELVLTYTDGETQNLGRVVGADGEKGEDGRDGQDGKPGKDGEKGADGADGRDGIDGKDGQDGANGTNAPAGEGSSVSDRCLPAVGIMALPLLALIPLGLAATVDVPALAPVKEQINKVGEQLPVPVQTAGPIAGAALAIAAIATLATVCSTEGGSSK